MSFYLIRYQALAIAEDRSSDNKTDSISTGKKINPDWIIGLGENSNNMQVSTMLDKLLSVSKATICIACSFFLFPR